MKSRETAWAVLTLILVLTLALLTTSEGEALTRDMRGWRVTIVVRDEAGGRRRITCDNPSFFEALKYVECAPGRLEK